MLILSVAEGVEKWALMLCGSRVVYQRILVDSLYKHFGSMLHEGVVYLDYYSIPNA